MPTRDPTSLRDGDDAARLESALDALAARVSVWDRDLGFRYGNAAAVAFLGIDGDLRGQPLSSFADPASVAAQMPYIERTLAGESLAFGRSTTAPGRLHSSYEEVRLEPLRVDGTITGILILVTDETELRRA